ncbi:MAG: ABC transporter substrate-binding protein [Thermomicrobiales bacterium]|nr:ABC transporter substrate-binding protein [Thermomicrobiales bacterium]
MIKRAAVLGLSAPVVAALLAACGGDDDGGAATTAASTATAASGGGATATAAATAAGGGATATAAATAPSGSPAAPAGQGKPGGELVISCPSAPLRIDPALTGSGGEYMITQAAYNNLIRVNEKLELTPELAESWDISDDGLSYTMHMVEGVKFHHGKELTSEDVKYTVERIQDEATASSGRSLFLPAETIETPDDYTVVFKLKAPFADFPYALGSTFGRIVPSDIPGAELNTRAVGTGPFKLETYEPGSQIVMVKNEDYWEEGLPYLDRYVQVQIPEQTAQAAALKAGQVQIFWDIAAETVSAVQNQPGIVVSEMPSPSFQPIGMRNDMAPWDDVRVRQALKYSVDRTGIVTAVLQGHGSEANDHQVPPISPYWVDTGIKERDIDKAKKLLADAGYPDGLDVELVASNERPGLVELATIVKALSEEAGFRISIKVVPWDVFVAEYNDTAPFFVTNWFGRPSIDETLYPYLHSTGSWNDEKYNNPEVDRLLEEGRAETDFEKRKAAYAQVQEIVAEDGPSLIAYHKSYITATREQVKGYIQHPIRWVDVRWTWLDV